MIQASAILRGNGLQMEAPFEQKLEALLQECRTHLRTVDEPMIRRAFLLGYWAHRNDRRANGEPYFSHPVEVAFIVVRNVGIDDVSVAAALLHDVVEDTELSLDLIREEFGPALATIIDGLTKMSGVFASRALGQAENVRKLILSIGSDIRVILIKFADRLHNMRTLDALPRERQIKIATETRDLFAPLAHRFGLSAIKMELEDLCLKYLEPEAFREIVTGLRATRHERETYVKAFIAPVQTRLEQDQYQCEIYGRSKSIFSIYRKMREQNKPLDEIYDLLAIRIILQSEDKKGKEDCWRVYSLITDLYKPIPERFRDFISVPKSNGYQSLHTTVIGPEGRRVEVQIRTRKMHEVAERGVAAHWKYKEGIQGADQSMDEFLTWIRDVLENPQGQQAADFIQDLRLNLYDEEIYVFTPKGDLLRLPKGATPVDFAFQVHSEVGFHCIGAKVNGKMMPLSHPLRSGDQVEIITSKKQTPNPDWVKFVKTQKARSKVRQWINEQRRKVIEAGRDLWAKRAARAGIELGEQDLQRYITKLHFPNTGQLFYEIGAGHFDVEELIRLIQRGQTTPEDPSERGRKGLLTQYQEFLGTAHSTGRPGLVIDGQLHTDIATKYASCCNPIPGDEVFGYISRTGSIQIHRNSCRNAPSLLLNHAERIVQVDWSRQKDVQFVSALRIMGEDRVGIISDVTTVISKNLKTNIRSITVNSEDGVFEGRIVLYVSDLDHLRNLMERIKRIEGIYGVYRLEEEVDERTG
jgi:RelA/SpoT family (p)ppGpp synthetase